MCPRTAHTTAVQSFATKVDPILLQKPINLKHPMIHSVFPTLVALAIFCAFPQGVSLFTCAMKCFWEGADITPGTAITCYCLVLLSPPPPPLVPPVRYAAYTHTHTHTHTPLPHRSRTPTPAPIITRWDICELWLAHLGVPGP